MDPALLRQREQFLKANARNINNAPKFSATSASNVAASQKKHKKKSTAPKSQDELRHMKSLPNFDYATGKATEAQTAMTASLFGIMAKIVDYMKKRHIECVFHPLTLSECIQEMGAIGTMSKKTEQWLMEKLPENPKLQFDDQGRFRFKPPYPIRTEKQIIDQLSKNYRSGKGALLLSEMNECFAKADEVMKKISDESDECIIIPCQVNKKKDKAYFYNDAEVGIKVDDDYVNLWRATTVDHLDEKKIDEYLNKHGLTVIKDQAPRRLLHGSSAPKRKQNRRQGKIQNTHMGDILETYETG